MAALGLIIVVLFLLYAVWRIRYRYPPSDVPLVLCYHKLSDRICFEGTWMTRRRFIEQIERLTDAGYDFVSESEYLAGLDNRSVENSKRILLTFDDGYEALCDVYLDHLAPRGVPLLVFLVAGYAGRDNTWDLSGGRRRFRHLSWRQIEAMAQAGARFGSHGLTHTDLTRVDKQMLDAEVVKSKEMIESNVETAVRSFSYPFGRYDAESVAAVKAAGYTAGFSLYPRHSNEIIDHFALRRCGVYIIDTPRTIRWKLERSPVFWFEEMKCRTINGVAVLTPLLKRSFAKPNRDSDPGR
jgi:peptidoglycan/xylan/chitin deacetylase (PgdA/CDA1 family)